MTETYLVAVVFFNVQVIFSKWWLKNRSQGPIEFFMEEPGVSVFFNKCRQKEVSASPVLK
jgi:hypothetical protein